MTDFGELQAYTHKTADEVEIHVAVLHGVAEKLGELYARLEHLTGSTYQEDPRTALDWINSARVRVLDAAPWADTAVDQTRVETRNLW